LFSLISGPYVPGCIDVMTGFGADGTFMRLWYPTSLDNIKVSFTNFFAMIVT
jgi:hypothetical protein